jgi:two-component system sensor histidine kinase DctS
MDGSLAPPPPRPTRWRRALPWALLTALLVVAQSLLVWLTLKYEESRAQEESELAVTTAASTLKRELLRQMQELQALSAADPAAADWRAGVEALMARRPGLQRVEWRGGGAGGGGAAAPAPGAPGLFVQMPRSSLALEAELACSLASRSDAPSFSRSYFVPLPGGQGLEVMDLCIPVQRGGAEAGHLVGSFALARVLDAALTERASGRHEYSLVEADGTRLARVGLARGSNVFVAQQAFDIPGSTLHVRADAAAGRPSLIPNLATALVLGLSLLLFGVVFLLARDVRRRAVAERALAEALALRSAMEDSLPTGLRARDLQGNVTYANPAFCAMVGFGIDELRRPGRPKGAVAAPPYWPPEYEGEYQKRQSLRLAGQGRPPTEAREGYETVFMRKNGERFPVMVYEAPLVDGEGRHTGWMSAVVDLSAQRRVEDLSRQQQERLQASARLATVGEMASLLSHELNQPLAAIASYASGSLNLIEAPDEQTTPMLRQALGRIAEQADRAGRVIKSVHSFVRRREPVHETLPVDLLFEGVLPLVRLQARKSGTRIEIDLPPAESGGKPPRVRCDRTMVEQVLLNFSRNGIQAMEGDEVPLEQRVLTLRARQTHERWVTISVIDAGTGIAPEVAAKLFTPFFTTRSEGMGLGLSLCRTVVEQHGGALDFFPGPGGRGTEFRFSLPAPRGAEAPAESAAENAAENAAETGDTAGSASHA